MLSFPIVYSLEDGVYGVCCCKIKGKYVFEHMEIQGGEIIWSSKTFHDSIRKGYSRVKYYGQRIIY
jgi:hypothetical protein